MADAFVSFNSGVYTVAFDAGSVKHKIYFSARRHTWLIHAVFLKRETNARNVLRLLARLKNCMQIPSVAFEL